MKPNSPAIARFIAGVRLAGNSVVCGLSRGGKTNLVRSPIRTPTRNSPVSPSH